MESNIAFYEAIRYEYDLNEDSIVFDLGAYCGTFTEEISKRYDSYIYAFEPVKSFYDKIPESSKINKFNFAISDSDREGEIYVNGASTSAYCTGDLNNVTYKDIYNIIKEYDIKKIDLIKINIEGEEFKLLPRMIDTGIVNICENIQIQYHPFIVDSERLRHIINAELEKTHIQTYCYTFVWENWKKI